MQQPFSVDSRGTKHLNSIQLSLDPVGHNGRYLANVDDRVEEVAQTFLATIHDGTGPAHIASEIEKLRTWRIDLYAFNKKKLI